MSDLGDLYQELLLDHYRRPRNHGRIADADGVADGNNPLCGDRVRVFVRVRDDIVQDVKFEGGGCAISTASASIMTEAVKGQTIGDARRLFKRFHKLVTEGIDDPRGPAHGTGERAGDASAEAPPLGKLEVFAGVGEYPARVKCATLAWHTLEAALEHRTETVTTE